MTLVRENEDGGTVNEETSLLAGETGRHLVHGASVGDQHVDEEEGKESWNSSTVNTWRFVCTNLTLMIMGMENASIGALIPYIEPYYKISHGTVSTIFVIPFFGYLVAALLNNWVHLLVGQRGIAFMGPICRLMGLVAMALHPPTFWVLPAGMVFTAFGNGISDSAWNAWVGNLRNANELLGLIHGSYGIGATTAPLIASAMISKLHLPWYTFYYVLISLSLLELVMATTSFWSATAAAYRQKHGIGHDREAVRTSTVLSMPIPWIVSIFLFGYVGAEVSLGGWIPTFMIQVRHADGFLAGLVVTLFWGGFTLGRIVLGFFTGRIGEKLAIVIYLTISVVFQVVYWLVPSLEVTIASVILLGFFLGPLFPAAIVAMTKLLPAEQHVVAIGLTAAIGGGGSAIFPFAVGAIAETHGVQVLQPFVLALMGVIMLLWLTLPGGLERGGLEKARREGMSMSPGLQNALRWVKS